MRFTVLTCFILAFTSGEAFTYALVNFTLGGVAVGIIEMLLSVCFGLFAALQMRRLLP